MTKLLRSTVAITFALALAMVAGPSGCAAIVGADDYQVGSAEGTAGNVIGQAGVSLGAGGDAVSTGGGAGTHVGAGGRSPDASVPDAPSTKPESGLKPVMDASRPDVTVPDTGTGGKPLASGETLCTTTCTGAGLTCQKTAFGSDGICAYLCGDPTDCDSTHDCIGAVQSGFNPACVKKCPTMACPQGFSCWPISTGDVCLPTEWLPIGLGIGDDCVDDSQCSSGQCLRKPRGWCSRSCVLNDYCDGDYDFGTNYFDEFNECVSLSGLGGPKCIAGCTKGVSDTVCGYYAGTTCKTFTDVNGNLVDICAP